MRTLSSQGWWRREGCCKGQKVLYFALLLGALETQERKCVFERNCPPRQSQDWCQACQEGPWLLALAFLRGPCSGADWAWQDVRTGCIHCSQCHAASLSFAPNDFTLRLQEPRLRTSRSVLVGAMMNPTKSYQPSSLLSPLPHTKDDLVGLGHILFFCGAPFVAASRKRRTASRRWSPKPG